MTSHRAAVSQKKAKIDIHADKNEKRFGFDVVSQRVANIVINITEKMATKVLHLHPEESNFTAFLSEVQFMFFCLV
jgi:hypothetical protein